MIRFACSKRSACAMALILLAGACRSPYRESVLPESNHEPSARPIVNLGIFDAKEGTIDASASGQLVAASGLELFASGLSPEEVELLVGDPGLLAVDRLGRRRLADRIGRHAVLIGVVRPVMADELREWEVVFPFPLIALPVVALLLRTQIPYGAKSDVPHESITIRLVDLESGTVDAETLTITNRFRDRSDRMAKSVATAARIMRLGTGR